MHILYSLHSAGLDFNLQSHDALATHAHYTYAPSPEILLNVAAPVSLTHIIKVINSVLKCLATETGKLPKEVTYAMYMCTFSSLNVQRNM